MEIENISISIEAKAQSANNAIDKLIVRLDKLSTSLGKVNGSNLQSLSNGITGLSTAMSKMAGVKTVDFSRIANGLGKFNSISTSNLANVSTGLVQLSNGLGTISNVSNLGGISKVVNSLKNIATVDMSKFNPGQFNLIGSSVRNFVASMNGIGSVDSSISGLINSMARLSASGQYISNVSKEFPNIANQIVSFVNQLNGLNINFDLSGLSSFIANIKNLGGKVATNAISNIPKLGNALAQVMTTLSKAPQVSQSTIRLADALARLSANGSKVGTASRSLVNGLRNTNSAMKTTSKRAWSLASAFGRFYASYFMVIRGAKGLWNSIKSTADYMEALNYYTVSFNKIGKEWSGDFEKYGYENAEAYAKSFTDRMSESFAKMSGIQFDSEKGLLSDTGMKNLGMNIQEITQYGSQLASVTNSVGQTGEVSLAAAKSFTKLAGDMSSLFNQDYSSVMKNIQSGLIGQSRAMYKYGIDITNATLSTYAYNLGLSKSVSEMTQAEKMQLRMLAILDQSKVSWGDLARTINSPSNMIRQFTTNLKETGMILGQLFIPLLQKVMPVINGVTIAIKRLLSNIARFMGIKMDEDSFGQGFSSLEEDAYDISDGLDNATDSAKKLHKQLAGFDELENLSSNTDTSGGSGSGAGGGTIDLTDEILKATEEYEKVWNEAYNKMENQAQTFADKIVNVFKTGSFQELGTSISTKLTNALKSINWETVYGGAISFGSGLSKFLNGLITPELFGEVGKTIAGTLNTSIYNNLAFAKEFDFSNLGSSLASAVNNFFGTFDFGALADNMNEWVDGLGDTLSEFVKGIDKDKVKDALSDFIENIELDTVAVAIAALSIKKIGVVKIASTAVSLISGAIVGKLASKLGTTATWSGIGTAIVTGLRGALASIGGIGGLLFTDLGTIIGAGTLSEIGLTIGTGLIGGIVAAFAGWNFGQWIYEKISGEEIEETFLQQMSGIKEAFSDGTWKEALELWSKDIEDSFVFIGEEAKNLWNNIKKSFKDGWKSIVDWWEDSAIGKWFDENVAPWFNEETWVELWTYVKQDFKDGWNDIVEWWKTNAVSVWFRDNVKPFFTKEYWVENLGSIKEAVKTKWKELTDWWSETAIVNWWNDDVKPFFTTDYWKTKLGSIKDAIKSKWDDFTSWWKDTAIVTWWDKNVSPYFSKDKWTFSGIKDGLESAFNGAIEGLKTIWNGFATWINKALKFDFSGFNKEFDFLGETYELGIPEFSVTLGKLPTFYTGGFPEDGLFMANHNELVGQFSNGKTAVANNQQITQGIADAVYPAVYNAMVTAMANQGIKVDVGLETDSDGVFSLVQTKANDYTRRTGNPAFGY